MVTIALILNEYFFICESTENVPEPPPIVTMRRPTSRSPARLGAGTVLLLWLISDLPFTRRLLLRCKTYKFLIFAASNVVSIQKLIGVFPSWQNTMSNCWVQVFFIVTVYHWPFPFARTHSASGRIWANIPHFSNCTAKHLTINDISL